MRSTPNAADTRYYHHDGLGSVVATSNAAGAMQTSTRFDAWGNILNATGSTPQFGYTGQVPDATGLIHYRARCYDPAMGRFTQRDPAGFADGINLYAYVGNSPTNFTDPLGLGRVAVAATSGLGSTFPGNDSNNNSLAANSGCGGRVGMCHTPDRSSSNIGFPSVSDFVQSAADNLSIRLQAGAAYGTGANFSVEDSLGDVFSNRSSTNATGAIETQTGFGAFAGVTLNGSVASSGRIQGVYQNTSICGGAGLSGCISFSYGSPGNWDISTSVGVGVGLKYNVHAIGYSGEIE